MDMSNPAAFVSAEILHFYVGRRVRALMQVVRSDGGVVIGKSTDEKQLIVKGFPPAPLTTFVEVFGIVNSDKSIAAEIWINFGDSIDMFNYNKLCQLANGELKYLFLDSILHRILCTEDCETYQTALSAMPLPDVKTLSKD
ncbi:replication protein A 14 kDa subunit B isoform X6 [Vigna radiata var. radiata]|nr:replication protein A 14 kDa subunit B isoform X6 [Vigna radiata var. radiata]